MSVNLVAEMLSNTEEIEIAAEMAREWAHAAETERLAIAAFEAAQFEQLLDSLEFDAE